jgi:hypothetical protein
MSNTPPCPDCQNQVSFSTVSCPKSGWVIQDNDIPCPVRAIYTNIVADKQGETLYEVVWEI